MPTCKIESSELVETVAMREMQPLQWAVITGGEYKGDIVMRTAGPDPLFEVINLTRFTAGDCWTTPCTLHVKLGKGPLYLTINN